MFAIDSSTYRTKNSFTNQKGRNVTFLVLHYTAAGFKSSVSILTEGNVSAHYLIPDSKENSYQASGFTNVKIFNLVDERNIAWHAGVSSWRGSSSLNNNSIGVENVNLATAINGEFNFPDYGDEQIQAIIFLCKEILARNPLISPRNVVAHSDISPGRKSDPGPKFPWKILYDNGIGAWYDDKTFLKYHDMFLNGIPTESVILNKLEDYGYDIHSGATPHDLIRSFQLHFSPLSTYGNIDVETCAALYALTEKYT